MLPAAPPPVATAAATPREGGARMMLAAAPMMAETHGYKGIGKGATPGGEVAPVVQHM